jgi:hypothetical protein
MTQLQRSNSETPENVRTVLQTAYERLQKNELVVFCQLRGLQTTGSPSQLARRLVDHDLSTYQPSSRILQSVAPHISSPVLNRITDADCHRETLAPSLGHHLPLELVAAIIDHIGDWELSKAGECSYTADLQTTYPTYSRINDKSTTSSYVGPRHKT